MQYTKAFSSFAVKDIEQAKAFYSDTLNLPFKIQPMGVAELNVNGLNVMVYPKEDHVPAAFTVLNFVVDDVKQAVQSLKEKGIEFENYDDFDMDENNISHSDRGPVIAWFKDPFGNIISVIEN